MKTLTVVCPAYNEADGIRDFYGVLKAELAKLSNYSSKILFVDDGSRDSTYSVLLSIAKGDKNVQVAHFSRNFGHQLALLAGIDHSKADVVIMMDSDLQHPPAVIPLLLAEYEKGNDIVYTVRDDSQTVGMGRRIMGKIFYWVVNRLSDVPISENASDFRLISGRVAELIRTQIRERNIFLRGIISWIGFKSSYVHFKTAARKAGVSKYSVSRLLQFAIFGIISFSKKPLRLATISGLLIALIGFVVALVTIVQSFINNSLPDGWATVVVLLSILGGVQIVFLGILGEYVGAIFDEAKARPNYIIEDIINA